MLWDQCQWTTTVHLRAGQLNNDLKLTTKLCEVEEELQIQVMILSTFVMKIVSKVCPTQMQTNTQTNSDEEQSQIIGH